MADIVLLVGGTGTQAGKTPICGVCDKTAWDNLDVSDIVGANGSPIININAATDIDYTTTDYPIIDGDFSALTSVLTKADGGKVYVYLTTVIQDAGSISGLFEITAAGSGGLTVYKTNLDGQTIIAPTGENPSQCAVITVGGCLNSIAAADTFIVGEFGATLAHNVDVLDNLSETLGATTMAASSTLLKQIRYIGTVYDNTTVNNNFAYCGNDKSKFPLKDMTSNSFTNSGNHLDFINIAWTGTNTNQVVALANYSNLISCSIVNTSNNNFASTAVHSVNSDVVNCYIKSTGGASKLIANGALQLSNSYASGCYVVAEIACGIGVSFQSSTASALNNIVIAGASNTAGSGIIVFGNGTLSRGAQILNNYAYGFGKGINFITMADIADRGVVVENNIIWGNNAAGSYGIYNTVYETIDSTALIGNNFIGNCQYEDNFAQELDSISLSANPFKNGSGNMNVATDFYLNDTAGGGALVKSNWQPLDFDLNGTRDNYQCGTICEQPAAGGGGVSQLINGGFIK